MAAPQMWEVILRRGHDGKRFPSRHVTEDLERPDDFRDHLLAIARLEDSSEINSGDSWIGEYELEVIDPEQPNAGPVRVLRWRP